MGRNAKLRQQRKQPGSKPTIVKFLHSQPDPSMPSQENASEPEKPSSFLGKLFDRFKPRKKPDATSGHSPSADAVQFFDRYQVLVSALAWEGYEKNGRGLLWVKDGIESFEAEYVPIGRLRTTLRDLDLDSEDIAKIANMIKSHDPEADLVLLFQGQEENQEATVYLPQALDPSPPESYRLRQERMAAEADRAPELPEVESESGSDSDDE